MTIALLFIAGLALLVLGAELLVRGASKLALSAGISPLVVGLTVVAYGTSSPEMAVSVQAAFSGRNDLAVGNVVGSNIFNVLFILGASAVISRLIVARQLVRQEVPAMIEHEQGQAADDEQHLHRPVPIPTGTATEAQRQRAQEMDSYP